MTKLPIAVITSVERRRRWSREDKERLVAACLEPGVNGGVKTGHGAEQKSATAAPA